jgi:hypothetical protein
VGLDLILKESSPLPRASSVKLVLDTKPKIVAASHIEHLDLFSSFISIIV